MRNVKRLEPNILKYLSMKTKTGISFLRLKLHHLGTVNFKHKYIEQCYLAYGRPGRPWGSRKARSNNMSWSLICLTANGLKKKQIKTTFKKYIYANNLFSCIYWNYLLNKLWENRRANQEWTMTFQRNWQHRAHQKKKKHPTQYVLDTIIHNQTKITSYKQLLLVCNNTIF